MKAVPGMSDVETVLGRVSAPTYRNTLADNSNLEDAIFQKMDRLQVMLDMQHRLDSGDSADSIPNRAQFSEMLEEHAKELRTLLNRCFS